MAGFMPFGMPSAIRSRVGDGCVASFEYSDSQIIIKETIMKYHCIVRYAFLLCALVGVQELRAQLFQSVSAEEIPVAGMEFSRPVSFMPDGRSLLLTSATQAGLWLYDVEDHQTSQLTDALGAGSEPVVSADGNTVIHRTVSFSAAHQRLTALDVVDVSARRTERLLHPQRQVPAYRFSGNTAMALSPAGDMVYKVRGVAQADACQMPMVSLDEDGTSRVLSPNGSDATYLWPSLSPDGRRILYYVSGVGAYVCSTDGDSVTFVSPHCRAPQWYDGETIVGMYDTDDTQALTSSCIMAYRLDGQSQQLTSPSSFTMYPRCHAASRRIACCTADGRLVMLHVEPQPRP